VSKIILLRGNSGSGKTVVASALQQKFGEGTLLISQDNVRMGMLNVEDGLDNESINLLINLVDYGNKNCNITILEGILRAGIYKSLFKQVKELFGDNVYAYYFDLTFEETIRRHRIRAQMLNYDFGSHREQEMKSWWLDKDYLDAICEKKIAENVEENEMIEMIYRDVIKSTAV